MTAGHLGLFFRRLLGLQSPPKSKRERVRLQILGDHGEIDDPRIAALTELRGFKNALALMTDALSVRATHIYLVSASDQTTVAFRIDGLHEPVAGFTRGMGDALIAILKELAGLNPDEKRKPQEGRFTAQVKKQHIVDFRLTSSGTSVGEKLAVHILDNVERGVLCLSELGMPGTIGTTIQNIVTKPGGLFIVCGPSDSGRSTTLHACLRELDLYQLNVVALEHPIEHRIGNVCHIDLSPMANKTVATELPTLARQGLDVLCIGEITDPETAMLACQAAKDGRLVLSAIEAVDSVAALGTLLELGVKPSFLRRTLSAILAQRLVRVLCRRCRVRYKPDPTMLCRANLPADEIKFFYRPPKLPAADHGAEQQDEVCEKCGGRGYYGRTGIFELLIVDDRIREMIREDANLKAIKEESIKQGMKRLQEEGMRLVIEGTTSIEELVRVCS